MTPSGDGKTSPPIDDWAPGDATPAWTPIAGGKGWGQPGGSGSSPAAGQVSAAGAAASGKLCILHVTDYKNSFKHVRESRDADYCSSIIIRPSNACLFFASSYHKYAK